MKESYWKLFMESGKIDDYLNYKNSQETDCFVADGKEPCESDCTDRNGVVYDAGG